MPRVGDCIQVPDFYLVLHGLWCWKSTIIDLSNNQVVWVFFSRWSCICWVLSFVCFVGILSRWSCICWVLVFMIHVFDVFQTYLVRGVHCVWGAPVRARRHVWTRLPFVWYQRLWLRHIWLVAELVFDKDLFVQAKRCF